MPPFIAANPQAIEQQAVGMDQTAYGLSDADFRQRYPQLYNTQQTFLNNLQNQESGNITPQFQNLWARSGLTGALGATGGWSMGTGTPGMANVARNLGLNQMQYQQQLLNQFQTANQTFVPRSFGLSGADASQIALGNIAGQNNWNQTDYAYKVQESQFAANMAAQQSVASANAANSTTGSLVGGAGTAVSALSMAVVAFCWLARAAYGGYHPRWKRFRYFMLTRAPRPVRAFYVQHGPQMANWLERHSWAKAPVRLAMEFVTLGLPYAALPALSR
jgi:hypothetical protein